MIRADKFSLDAADNLYDLRKNRYEPELVEKGTFTEIHQTYYKKLSTAMAIARSSVYARSRPEKEWLAKKTARKSSKGDRNEKAIDRRAFRMKGQKIIYQLYLSSISTGRPLGQYLCSQ